MKERAGWPSIRTSLLLLLTAAGFLDIIASSINANIEWVPTNLQFGVFQLLPAGYWLGLGLIGLSMILGYRNGNEHLFVVQALLLFLAIWGVPSFFERLPSDWDVYHHYFQVEEIMRTGSTLASGPYAYITNYPGFYVDGAVFSFLGHADPLQLLRFFPLFAAAFTLVSFYLFIRSFFPIRDFRLVLLIAMLADVWVQLIFNPQSLGLAAGLLALAFFEREGFRWMLASLAAFSYVVLSHPTTVPFVLGALVIREIIVRLPLISRLVAKKGNPWAFVLFGLTWLAWLSSGARTYSNILIDVISQRLKFLVDIPEETGRVVAARTTENIFTVAPGVRTALITLLGLLLVFCVFLYLFRSTRPKQRLPPTLTALCFLGLIIVPLDLVLLGAQLYDRGILYFVFCAPGIILIALISSPKRIERRRGLIRKTAMRLLLLLAILCAFTAFYQECFNVVSDRSLKASEFLAKEMPDGALVIGGTYLPAIWADPDVGNFTGVRYLYAYPAPFQNITRISTAALVFDRTSELWQEQYGFGYIYRDYLAQLDNSTKVYDSGAYMIIFGGPA